MKSKPSVNIFWFRRDLRLDDNTGLFHALNSGRPALPVFIFDTDILDKLEDKKDKRVQFIHNEIISLNNQLNKLGSSLQALYGKPIDVFRKLIEDYDIKEVYANHDYEPYAGKRDFEVHGLLLNHDIQFYTYKDQVIFEKKEITKADGRLYSIYTPYAKAWKKEYKKLKNETWINNSGNFFKTPKFKIPELNEMGFHKIDFTYPSKKPVTKILQHYAEKRDYPAAENTSQLGIHLRFGTISIRKLFQQVSVYEKFFSELIWREFFMMILANHPRVVSESYYLKYDRIKWRNNEDEFAKWCEGKTGYPFVDAGMRQLNETGYMHNRTRMITASFLTKHLLIDWRWGEKYFADKLLDYELAVNNGNWQWAAGTGCDASPYFRVFNPALQEKRFDPNREYVKKWIPEIDTADYPKPIVEHQFARDRAVAAYKKVITDNR
jgi:deoxyribodipyrimidine photo-lyase